MNALTTPQPNASLIALGVQRIVVSDESTSYRGPLAVHAAKKMPVAGMTLGPWTVSEGDRPGERILWHQRVGHEEYQPFHLPLGAIVATATLVDVVPIVERTWPQDLTENCVSVHPPEANMERLVSWTFGRKDGRNVTDQLPYGDFSTDGKPRYAWLLEDVKATTERCPACGGSGFGPLDDDQLIRTIAPYCPTCEGKGTCDPVPAKGRKGLWEWEPAA